MAKTLQDIRLQLQRGEVTSEQLVEEALASALSSEGQGGKTFIKVYDNQAMVQAKAIDQVRKSGVELHPLAGIPISIKDLFDVAGEITLSGSLVRRKSAPAKSDAHIVSKLRAAGAILIGRTNMTEFAFSGLGINPHYGTPLNPWDRKTGRIPGGSSSGAAISVTDNMAAAAIGTDTGGSVRIPSALCGLTGFKPTAVRVSKEGAFPLSTTLDSIGPLANSVSCCSILDQTMRGAAVNALLDKPVDGLTLAIPQTIVLDDMDRTVATKFENVVKVHSKNINQLKKDCEINRVFRRLYKKFCPGAISFVLKLKKTSKISKIVTNNSNLVAVRFPSHHLTRKILKEIDFDFEFFTDYNLTLQVNNGHIKGYLDDKLIIEVEDKNNSLKFLNSSIIKFYIINTPLHLD